jgi:hypothetical protein
MKAIRLPLFGVALLLAGCAADPLPFDGVANVKLLMTSVVEPAAEVYWDAVGTIIDENGIDEFAPSTDEEWQAVRNVGRGLSSCGGRSSAGRLVSSTGLGVGAGTPRDPERWRTKGREPPGDSPRFA